MCQLPMAVNRVPLPPDTIIVLCCAPFTIAARKQDETKAKAREKLKEKRKSQAKKVRLRDARSQPLHLRFAVGYVHAKTA